MSGTPGARLLQIGGMVAIGVVITAIVVAFGLPGNQAAAPSTLTPPVADSFRAKLERRDDRANAFCREVGTVQASPRRTPAQWTRYLDIQVFLATDGRRARRDPAFGAALTAAQRNAAKRSAYVTGCRRTGLQAG